MKENDWQLLRYFLLFLILPFMVALSFYGIFRIWENLFEKNVQQVFCHCFICIATVKSLESSHLFQTVLSNYYFWNAFDNPKRKITCENCGTQTIRNYFVRQKKRCLVGPLYYTQCPKFSMKSRNDLNNHITKNQSAPELDVAFKCKLC